MICCVEQRGILGGELFSIMQEAKMDENRNTKLEPCVL